MIRNLASVLIIVLLLVTGAMAQTPYPYGPPPQYPPLRVIQPVWWGFEFRALPVTAGLSFPDTSFKASKLLAEFALRASIPGTIGLGYSLTPGLKGSDIFTPTGEFKINRTQFGQDPQQSSGQGGQSSQQKPITLDWSTSVSHRVELVGLWPSLPINPLVAGEYLGLTITGTKDDGGQSKTDTETMSQFFVGVGGMLNHQQENLLTSVRFAASDKYSFAEVVALYQLNRFVTAMFGYQHRSFKYPNALVRIHGLVFGVEF